MAQHPALPLFTDAILADCGHLTDSEMGIYIKLLMHTWRAPKCRLPNDPVWLAKKMGRSVKAFEKEVLPIMREYYHTAGNWWQQKRLTKEHEYVSRKREINSDSAKARWNKEKKACERNANAMPPDALRTQCPQPHLTKGKKEPPTPKTESVDNSVEGGVLKNGKFGSDFDIARFLTDGVLAAAKQAAKGWDIYHLAGVYNAGINSGDRPAPRVPGKAFPVWCGKYTKGKAP